MAVIEFHVTRKTPYAGGFEFADTGAYEQIDGILTYSVDPFADANGSIVDLELVPRDEDGRVRFTGDLSLVTPVDAASGNRRLLVELPNRGRRRAVPMFNRDASQEPSASASPGDGFLFRHGYSVASVGWQWDIYRSDAFLGIEAPHAQINGQPVTGQTVVEIRPNELHHTHLLADRIHRPLSATDTDQPDALLLVREFEDGEDASVPRSEWRFAKETPDGVVPSREHLYLESGFQPGKYYQVVYATSDAPVAGAGLLAVRDTASFLRYDGSDDNPTAGRFDRVYGFGVSQTGRMLREFLYIGLNVDERGRIAHDGLMPHVAGARRGAFNHRFAQPSNQSYPNFGHRFPFADDSLTDPVTEETSGLLDRSRATGATPKVIYTNSSAEYWRGDCALMHIDPLGATDLRPAAETRIYHFAGTQHGAGSLPLSRDGAAEGARGRYDYNVLDHSPLMRAALINLDRWVSDGVEPPPNRHPQLSDGTLANPDETLAVFDRLPDVVTPDRSRLFILRTVDLGSRTNKGIGRYPTIEGEAYPILVPAVDEDGNETGGIRLPDLTVPVGTHTGWNPRSPETGSPEQIIPMQGFTRWFAFAESQRSSTDDPRFSLNERYGDRASYLAKVREAAQRLIEQGYALAEDLELLVENAAERYDAAVENARA